LESDPVDDARMPAEEGRCLRPFELGPRVDLVRQDPCSAVLGGGDHRVARIVAEDGAGRVAGIGGDDDAGAAIDGVADFVRIGLPAELLAQRDGPDLGVEGAGETGRLHIGRRQDGDDVAG